MGARFVDVVGKALDEIMVMNLNASCLVDLKVCSIDMCERVSDLNPDLTVEAVLGATKGHKNFAIKGMHKMMKAMMHD